MSVYAVAIILERHRFFKENSINKIKDQLFNFLSQKNLSEAKKLLKQDSCGPFNDQIVAVIESEKSNDVKIQELKTFLHKF